MKASSNRGVEPLFRTVLYLLSALFLLPSALFYLSILPAQQLLSFIHTGRPDWELLYANTLRGLPRGLFLAGLTFFLIAWKFSGICKTVSALLLLDGTRFVLIVTGTAIILRIAWLIFVPTQPWTDAEWYHTRAIQMSHGLGYRNDLGALTAFWPIGYPMLLSVLYRIWSSIIMAKIANLFFSVGIMMISYLSFRKYTSETTARIVLMLLAFSVPEIAYPATLFTEVAFSFFFILALAFAVSALRNAPIIALIATGVLTGCAMLIRPVAILLPAVLGLVFFFKEKSTTKTIRATAIISIVVALVLLPNILRNYQIFHAFVPVSTNGGINFWIGNNSASRGTYSDPPPLAAGPGELEQSRAGYQQGLVWIENNPGAAALNCLRKLAFLYWRDDQGVLFSFVSLSTPGNWTLESYALIMANVMYYLVCILLIKRVWTKRRLLTLEETYLVGLCLAWTLFHMVYFGADRFHFPLLPIFFYFAAGEIEQQLATRVPIARQGLGIV